MVFLSKIYTKSGDDGSTSLGDGRRVSKDDPRVEAYGAVDELNAILGLMLTIPDLPEQALVREISNDLFDLGADLCVPWSTEEKGGSHLRVTPEQHARLESRIDALNAPLEPLRSFVLPGGTVASAWCHLARVVCRRAERRVQTLARTDPLNPNVLIYLNRLSDLLFVLARSINQSAGGDVLWIPGQHR